MQIEHNRSEQNHPVKKPSLRDRLSLVVFVIWALGAILLVPLAGDIFSEMASNHIKAEQRIEAEKNTSSQQLTTRN